MKILIIGGTRFVGRAVVDAALGRGHTVTLLNRGRSAPDLYPGLERLRADRAGDLSVLDGRRWHAVIDVCGYEPEVVARSVQALHGAAEHYVFVSTVSVYVDHSRPQIEGQPVLRWHKDLSPGDRYGARKAGCEQVVDRGFGDASLIVRAGMIVGPHDGTDRFAYWPRRVARGGRILAPGHPTDPVQFIDVRDLAGWMVRSAERGLSGIYNATGETITFGALLSACQANIPGSDTELVWVDSARLLAAGADPWMGVPMWIAAPGWEAANRVDVGRALADGLALRPLSDTIHDTLSWDLARGGPPPGEEALTPDRERSLLDG